jgi:uncharacterized protein (DUF952 family)
VNPVCAHRLFHVALPDDWAAARRAGAYTVSTRGATLAEVGYLHASYENQVESVANAFYGDVDKLVLLVIDRDQLDVPVVDESATRDPADEHFPHLYGALPVEAVVEARPWRRRPGEPWRFPSPAKSRPDR